MTGDPVRDLAEYGVLNVVALNVAAPRSTFACAFVAVSKMADPVFSECGFTGGKATFMLVILFSCAACWWKYPGTCYKMAARLLTVNQEMVGFVFATHTHTHFLTDLATRRIRQLSSCGYGSLSR